MVCGDLGTSGKEVAASWLTVPEKMMLDFVVSAARSMACGAAALVQPHKASHQPAPAKIALKNNAEIFMWASLWCKAAALKGPLRLNFATFSGVSLQAPHGITGTLK